MNAEWWEDIVRFICSWWWLILLILALGLTAYFTRGFWLRFLM